MLRDGGNAIDAALAAAAVLCVVQPHLASVAGDVAALVWPAGASSPITFAGLGAAPAALSADAVRAAGNREMPSRGALTVAVPGAPVGWGRILEAHGSVGIGAVVEAAVALAGGGFVVGPQLAAALGAADAMRRADADASRLFPPLKEGMRLSNPDLAAALSALGHRGFAGFYRGEIGRAIVAAVRARGGLLAESDLFLPRPSGQVAAAAPAPLGALYAMRGTLPDQPIKPGEEVEEGASVCAADENGNAIALVQALGGRFGSEIIVPGTGIVLNNRAAAFRLDGGAPHGIAPGVAPPHGFTPAILLRHGAPAAAIATGGGPDAARLTMALAAAFDEGSSEEEVLRSPRAAAAIRAVEADHERAVELARSGWRLLRPLSPETGRGTLVSCAGGGRLGAADPRSEGSVGLSV